MLFRSHITFVSFSLWRNYHDYVFSLKRRFRKHQQLSLLLNNSNLPFDSCTFTGRNVFLSGVIETTRALQASIEKNIVITMCTNPWGKTVSCYDAYHFIDQCPLHCWFCPTSRSFRISCPRLIMVLLEICLLICQSCGYFHILWWSMQT